MDLDEFLRTFNVRAPNLMWLLGAGASAASGIPTAYDLIWQFKRTLYCSANRVSLRSCEDLSSPVVQQRLQRFFDGQARYPKAGASEEYSAYFEAAYPDASDRRSKIDEFVRDATPSFGHKALAAMLATGKSRLIWTTNFDRLVEDASVQQCGSTTRLVTAGIDNAELVLQALNEGRWPILAKLHGDFQSRRLKNVTGELQNQDATMRAALLESCRRFGLVVAGYSGRDDSIMDSLEAALDSANSFPAGIFWFHRPETNLLPRVNKFLDKAKQAGVKASLVTSVTFDELLGDILRQLDRIPDKLFASLEPTSITAGVSIARSGDNWPVLRMNALPVVQWPRRSRLVECTIGNTKAVREAIKAKKTDVVGARTKAGVIAFGSDTDIRTTFNDFGILGMTFQSLEAGRLGFESSELGLIRDAFRHALVARRPLNIRPGRGSDMCTLDDVRATDEEKATLEQVAKGRRGVIPQTDIRWTEAIRIRLEYRLDKMWCLLEPTIDTKPSLDPITKDKINTFRKNRSASRYNRQWNELLDCWVNLLVGKSSQMDFVAFNGADGADASFVVLRTTAFSRRSGEEL
jgi:NAD-dependent SIR2 family protein deacetylase